MNYKLRPHQEVALAKVMDFIHNDKAKSGIIVAPTGAGKSLYVANIAKDLHEPVLCLQSSKELLQQNYEKYTSYGESASIYSASMGIKEVGNVTFATPQSVANDISLFKRFKYVLVDECHLASKVGGSMHNAIKAINPIKTIGLTATPIYLMQGMHGAELRMMNRTRDSFFKKIIHVTQIKELVEKGYWAKLVYENRYVDTSMLQSNSNGSEYTDASLIAMYEANNTRANLLTEIQHLKDEGRKSILVFVPSVQEADELAKLVPNSASVSSKTPKKERDDIINGFKNLHIQVIFNVNLLSVGFDHPQLDAVITARATASMAVYYQQLGRICRIHEFKKDGKIVDLSGNSIRFGKVEDLTFEEVEGQGWGMFSNDRLLSGVPLLGGFTIMKDEWGKEKEKPKVLDTGKMSFGKYSGMTYEDVFKKDSQYLIWISSEKFVPSFPMGVTTKEAVTKFLKGKFVNS